ncbi:MAG: folylpolyglutamate synthase/dihydrofolate synthase family protein [Leptolyngbyaceae cyanobacterium]
MTVVMVDQSCTEAIAHLLQQFSQFGIKLGLESTYELLKHLDNPHRHVPMVHVAGTNGKGSVCAYLSSILAEAGYRVGRYTSPHLVDWTERLWINGETIAPATLLSILEQITQVIRDRTLTVTQFEIVTAAAWLYFAQQSVDLVVMEVGLGGRLDATNVCDRPLASVITSISRDHWQQLGPTLGHIATEKAGILKPHCPAIIGPMPPEAENAIAQHIHHLNCPAHWVQPATPLTPTTLQYHPPTSNSELRTQNSELTYTIPLLGDYQRINSALAIATSHVLQAQGWSISTEQIQEGLAKTLWAGRLQWLQWRGLKILVDGAHNQASAAALRRYVDDQPQPIHWIMGMLSTKDHEAIFRELLRGGDRLSLVPIPNFDSAQPQPLVALAQLCCPDLSVCQTHPDLFSLLDQLASTTEIASGTDPSSGTDLSSATHPSSAGTIVLCGSLYLIGTLFNALATT